MLMHTKVWESLPENIPNSLMEYKNLQISVIGLSIFAGAKKYLILVEINRYETPTSAEGFFVTTRAYISTSLADSCSLRLTVLVRDSSATLWVSEFFLPQQDRTHYEKPRSGNLLLFIHLSIELLEREEWAFGVRRDGKGVNLWPILSLILIGSPPSPPRRSWDDNQEHVVSGRCRTAPKQRGSDTWKGRPPTSQLSKWVGTS